MSISLVSPNNLKFHLANLFNKFDFLILSKIKNFTKNYSNLILDIEAEDVAIAFIQELKHISEYNIFIAREGLFQLLNLNHEKIQQETVEFLKPLFSLDSLQVDVHENSPEHLITCEQQLSQALKACVRSSSFSQKQVLSLLSLYYDLLNRLWYVAHLKEDPACYSLIVEKYLPVLINQAESWKILLSKEKDSNIQDSLKNIEMLFQKIRPSQANSSLISKSEIYHTLGNEYRDLKNFQQAIEFYEKYAQTAQDLNNFMQQGEAYFNLGDIYRYLGEYENSIKFYEKCLKIAEEIKYKTGIGNCYGSLGIVYEVKGDYYKAIQLYGKQLIIAQQLDDANIEGNAYGNLGNAYFRIGEYLKGVEFYQRALKLAKIAKDPSREAIAYGNLGNIYFDLEKYEESLRYYKECLKLAKELEDHELAGSTCSNLGNVYRRIGKHHEAIEYIKKSIAIFESLCDLAGEGLAYGNLGNALYSTGEYKKAIECHEKDLEISQRLRNPEGEAQAYNNLAIAYAKLNEVPQAEKLFRKSIAITSQLYGNLGNEKQWMITFFETIAIPYVQLEKLFLVHNPLKALEITDERRSRALVSVLAHRLTSSQVSFSKTPLTTQEMQQLAEKLNTTFVIYSLETFKKDSYDCMGAWVITPQGAINFQPLPWAPLQLNTSPSKLFKEEIQHLVQTIEEFQKEIQKRGGDALDDELLALAASAPEEMKQQSEDKYKQQKKELFGKLVGQNHLASWYRQFITPIQAYLPKDPEQTVTFITDGVLSQLPFGAFYNVENKAYLIEQHAISTAPSLKMLQLLEHLRKSTPSSMTLTSLIVGNPDTQQIKNRDLKAAEQEADQVMQLLNATPDEVYKKEHAMVSRIIQQMPLARWIHLSCHGERGHPQDLLNMDPHSVFEGYFKLAPDHQKHKAYDQHAYLKGYLLSRQIAQLSLKAELVFLSACYSGSGKIQKEGTIGPIWSFLAAGASTVMATYWPLPDSPATVKIVEQFYKKIIDEKIVMNKAQALRQAVLMVLQEDREDFIQWGAFFITGLLSTNKKITKELQSKPDELIAELQKIRTEKTNLGLKYQQLSSSGTRSTPSTTEKDNPIEKIKENLKLAKEKEVQILENLEKVIKTREQFGEQSLDLAASYDKLGDYLKFLKQYSRALIYLRKSFEIKRNFLGINDDSVIRICNEIAELTIKSLDEKT